MRKAGILLALMAVVALAAGVVAGEKAWFDMENCGMCKPLAAKPELMMNMVWEHHNISNGIVSVTTVPEAYMDQYTAASMEMHKTGEMLMKGEAVELCGMCTALSGIMAKGARPEYVTTKTGSLMLVTSDDPEVVKSLQKWAKHNTDEMAKMKAGHEG